MFICSKFAFRAVINVPPREVIAKSLTGVKNGDFVYVKAIRFNFIFFEWFLLHC